MSIDDYNRIANANSEYRHNYKRWLYLYHSYMGGDQYRKGEYLTKYQLESKQEYQERLAVTPLDNHCRGVLSVYQSFLFRNPIARDFGSLATDPSVSNFIKDADLEGRSLNAFMKDVSTYAGVFGHTWVVLSKPNVQAQTRADELVSGARPYVAVITPLSVLDWHYTRGVSGYYELTYLKYIEDSNGSETVVKQWTPETITTTVVDDDYKTVRGENVEPNGLGKIPAVCVYSSRSPKRGLGLSIIDDIADLQRAIYNEYSEVESNIRLSGHPSLVKTAGTEAGAGAGAIIQMEENLDAGLKPYLLQPSGTSVSAIYESIQNKVDAIDRIAHLGAIRANEARTMSGVSREAEFAQLNARLAEIADNLEVAEEQIWSLYAAYQGREWDGYVDYPDSFNIRDYSSDLDLYLRAQTATVNSDTFRRDLQERIARLIAGDDDQRMDQIVDELNQPGQIFGTDLNGI